MHFPDGQWLFRLGCMLREKGDLIRKIIAHQEFTVRARLLPTIPRCRYVHRRHHFPRHRILYS